MEIYKKPLMDMYNALVMKLSEKNMEVQESLSYNKTNAVSLIQNRKADIDNFRASIDKITPTFKFEGEPEFRKEYNRILAMIESIEVN
jgi:hypothetical protein